MPTIQTSWLCHTLLYRSVLLVQETCPTFTEPTVLCFSFFFFLLFLSFFFFVDMNRFGKDACHIIQKKKKDALM